MRVTLRILMSCTTLLLVAAQGWAQFPGGSPRSSFNGGPSRSSSQDPNQRWNERTGGKDTWVRAEISDPNLLRTFDSIAGRIGITNGVMTRQQYLDYSQQRSGSRGGPSGSFPSPGMPAQGPSASPGPSTDPRNDPNSPDFAAYVESRFRRADQNGDGLLNYDEMSESLRIERDKWDRNRDGFIDLTEYKAYYASRTQQRLAERGGSGSPSPAAPGLNFNQVIVPVEEERKPVVYRAGKLPKELPSWFSELDIDQDGQIGLYEWRASGRSIDEFDAYDRNGDGFLVIEEVLHVVAQAKDHGADNPSLSRSGRQSGFPGASFSSGYSGQGPGRDGGPNRSSSFSDSGKGRNNSFSDSGKGMKPGKFDKSDKNDRKKSFNPKDR